MTGSIRNAFTRVVRTVAERYPTTLDARVRLAEKGAISGGMLVGGGIASLAVADCVENGFKAEHVGITCVAGMGGFAAGLLCATFFEIPVAFAVAQTAHLLRQPKDS